jgi:hypothetical protein
MFWCQENLREFIALGPVQDAAVSAALATAIAPDPSVYDIPARQKLYILKYYK